ncbi:MAG: flagellar hook-basal body complex protein FliE [Rhodocyclaceae bacterium]
MSIESIAAIAALQGTTALGAAQVQTTGAAATQSFSSMVSQGLNSVNSQLHASDIGLQKVAAGDAQSLHQLMIGMEEARLSFQLLMQVRNRVLEAYQDVMKMQV